MNWKTLLLSLTLAASLGAEHQTIDDRTQVKILTPAFAEQKTAKIRLANGLEAVIVSNPTIQKSAINLIVQAGSYQDPIEHQGLAHFLEHMLFLGTDEYPEEMGFARYLAEHSGLMNAYTTPDYTSYQFSVAPSGLNNALKRFSSFFKNPLLSPSGVQRELNAIDQEFAKGFNSEGTIGYYVLKTLVNEDHPAHRFTSGNSKSLAKATPDDLRLWFTEHYGPDRMKLYVLSSLDLDALVNMVETDFSTIPLRKTIQPAPLGELFNKEMLGKEVIIPVSKDLYSVEVFWQIPAELMGLDREPDELLNYILSHQGKESLFSYLKEKGWVHEIQAAGIQLSNDVKVYDVQFVLTEKGFQERENVIEQLFGTLHLLERNPYPQALYDEVALLKKQSYQFQEMDDPFNWARKQGEWLAREPLETYPERSLLMGAFEPEQFQNLLKTLTPERCIVFTMVPKSSYKEDLHYEEPWMGISYNINSIPQTTLTAWDNAISNPQITLNQQNPWIAVDTSVTGFTSTLSRFPEIPTPKKILDTPGATLFYVKDTLYELPRSFIRLQIQSPTIQESKPKQAALADLFVKALEIDMGELIYDAKSADLAIKFEHAPGGIQLSAEGFTESLKKAFPSILHGLSQGNYSEAEFQKAYEILSREYHNDLLDAPVLQSFDYFKSSFLEDYSSVQQKKTALKSIDYSAFKEFASRLFKKTYIKGLIAGSLTTESAQQIGNELKQTFHPTKDSYAAPFYPQLRSLEKSKSASKILLTTKASGNALLLVLGTPSFSAESRNCQQILSSAMWQAFFSELRTKQQTGYIVKSDSLDLYRHLYSYFALQSSTHSPEELLWRFEQFFESYLRNLPLQEIPQERFDAMRLAQIDLLKQPPGSFSLYGELLYKLAFDIEDFEWVQKRLASLEILTYPQFTAFTSSLLGRQNKQRVAIMIQGESDAQPFEYINFKSIKALKEVSAATKKKGSPRA